MNSDEFRNYEVHSVSNNEDNNRIVNSYESWPTQHNLYNQYHERLWKLQKILKRDNIGNSSNYPSQSINFATDYYEKLRELTSKQGVMTSSNKINMEQKYFAKKLLDEYKQFSFSQQNQVIGIIYSTIQDQEFGDFLVLKNFDKKLLKDISSEQDLSQVAKQYKLQHITGFFIDTKQDYINNNYEELYQMVGKNFVIVKVDSDKEEAEIVMKDQHNTIEINNIIVENCRYAKTYWIQN